MIYDAPPMSKNRDLSFILLKVHLAPALPPRLRTRVYFSTAKLLTNS